MPYLLIENKGEAPISAFTVLGATTKRNLTIPGLIGTFGSGANMGTLDLLRHDLNPVFYSGKTGMSFTTKSLPVKDVSGATTYHRQVYVKYSGTSTKTEKLSWTLAYGTKDWSKIDYALREYVSNAIDAMLTQGIKLMDVWKHVRVEIVEDSEVHVKSGYTRIFVPANEQVRHFYAHLESWFLHIGEPESLGQTILEKNGRNLSYDRGVPLQRAVIYRRGVRVREFESDSIRSLYDYNFDDLDMNESRTVDDWVVQNAAGQAIKKASPSILVRVMRALIEGDNVWESRFDSYSLGSRFSDDKSAIAQNWQEAMKHIVGDNAVIVSSDADSAVEQVKRKGYQPVVLPPAFAAVARTFDLMTDDKVLNEDEKACREYFDATFPLTETLDLVWAKVEEYNMANGRKKPLARLFHEHMKAECERFGFYRDNTVFVHKDYATNINDALDLTVIEEVAHHVTGATDNSRDFQQWLMRFLHVSVFRRPQPAESDYVLS